jgi:thiol:disulfide interchange protein
MTGLALCVMMSVVGANDAAVTVEPASYEQAYKQAETNGRPLMVLVGADWCPGCQRMKGGVLARMLRGGKLSGVNYAVVNTDRDRQLAQQLMSGGSIPQLIVYTKTGKDTWVRNQITGATSEEDVDLLIAKARNTKAPQSQHN